MTVRKNKTSRAITRGARITRIEVVGLFAQFDYDLKPRGELSVENQKLVILYGDNGSGKTTILNLVFHLLSYEGARGHRSFLASTRFALLRVSFANGVSVSAERERDSLIGSFSMKIVQKGKEIASQFFEADEANRVRVLSKQPVEVAAQYSRFAEQLQNLGVSVHLLSDSRKIRSDLATRNESVEFTYITDPVSGKITRRRKKAEATEELGLNAAMNRFLQWSRQQALLGSDAGSRNVNSIYTEIVKSIASDPKKLRSNQRKSETADLILTLKEQSRRSNDFSRFGLAAKLSTNELISVLETAGSSALPAIARVLRPYSEGIVARLDALESVYNSIDTFVKTINEFYKFKRLDFDLSSGIQIYSEGDEILDPDHLSSGEKQLLLLFCNVISSQDRASIFIIDEPELSLNVKWQRRLMNALLTCIQGREIQLLIATHSLELITQHKGNVARLDPLNLENA